MFAYCTYTVYTLSGSLADPTLYDPDPTFNCELDPTLNYDPDPTLNCDLDPILDCNTDPSQHLLMNYTDYHEG